MGKGGGGIWLVSHPSPQAHETLDLLKSQGFDALAIDRAADALFMSASARPAAILLDCSVPDGGGLASVVGAFRETSHLAGVPILLFSQDPWSDPESFRNRALSAGGLPLRHFPIEADELLDLLGELLAQGTVSPNGIA